MDGCYELNEQKEPIDFWVANPPTVKETEEVLSKIISKLTKYMERQKIIIRDDDGGGSQIPIPDEDTLSKLQATSVTYRFATGKSKGKKAMVLNSITDNDHTATKGLVAKNSGFSQHAGVAIKAHERDRLEKVCRYIARPAVAEERLSTNDQGDVIYRFKKPWDDGTTAMKLTPMQLISLSTPSQIFLKDSSHILMFCRLVASWVLSRRDESSSIAVLRRRNKSISLPESRRQWLRTVTKSNA